MEMGRIVKNMSFSYGRQQTKAYSLTIKDVGFLTLKDVGNTLALWQAVKVP